MKTYFKKTSTASPAGLFPPLELNNTKKQQPTDTDRCGTLYYEDDEGKQAVLLEEACPIQLVPYKPDRLPYCLFTEESNLKEFTKVLKAGCKGVEVVPLGSGCEYDSRNYQELNPCAGIAIVAPYRKESMCDLGKLDMENMCYEQSLIFGTVPVGAIFFLPVVVLLLFCVGSRFTKCLCLFLKGLHTKSANAKIEVGGNGYGTLIDACEEVTQYEVAKHLLVNAAGLELSEWAGNSSCN